MTARIVAAAAETACLLEAHAPKPGNVAPGRDRPGLAYRDLVVSAQAVEAAFRRHARSGVGLMALHAVRATRRHARTNTNLGIVLLLAPLVKAALRRAPVPLRDRVRAVLAGLDRRDARHAYAAIRTARAGGLGRVRNQDVRRAPTATLLDCMRLAAGRDAIAREYATDYAATFEIGLPALRGLRARGLGLDQAIVETYLELLAASPDTLVARRHGARVAAGVSRDAAAALRAGATRTAAGVKRLARLDVRLRNARPPINPGATADLVTAVLFVWLLQGAAPGRSKPRR